jgi:DnaK suppressor protein
MSNVTSMKSTDAGKRRAALAGKLQELCGLRSQRDELQIEYAADPVDQVRSGQDREIVISRLDQQARSIRDVRTALAKIEDGSYGLCEQCEEPIAAKRLDAVPWARLCVSCQSNAETGGGEQDDTRAGRPAVLFDAAA